MDAVLTSSHKLPPLVASEFHLPPLHQFRVVKLDPTFLVCTASVEKYDWICFLESHSSLENKVYFLPFVLFAGENNLMRIPFTPPEMYVWVFLTYTSVLFGFLKIILKSVQFLYLYILSDFSNQILSCSDFSDRRNLVIGIFWMLMIGGAFTS